MKLRVLSRKQRRELFVKRHKGTWTPFFAIWPRRVDTEHLVIGRCMRRLTGYNSDNVLPCEWTYRDFPDHAVAKLTNQDPKSQENEIGYCVRCGRG